ncbi:MAG: FKBP-type peptidyl-prolyl cis-trans isomerase [Coriobacteriales bacterium]|jgi:peptidylprolyl isomerase|nr:FKBP-type peptidyl-prolyl cis-trans isomerase [Coriobacteriales bacterium]
MALDCAAKVATVSFLYKGRLEDGEVFDDGEHDAHTIMLGRSQVMPVLERELIQMQVGEERTVSIAAEDAYGLYSQDAIVRVPVYKIPDGDKMPVGETILWRSPRSHKPVPAKVKSVINQVAELDFNHPLAGQNIVYWVKVVDKQN